MWIVSRFIVEVQSCGTHRFFVVCLLERVKSKIPLDENQ